MYSIGQLARRCGLSRSTLLYYDRLGLLSASSRSHANYRRFSEADRERLEKICLFRDAGVPLQAIKALLGDAGDLTAASFLEGRIHQINAEVHRLRMQQKKVVRLLLGLRVRRAHGPVDRAAWNELFQAAGFDRHDQWQWHHEFEIASPQEHRGFLESAGVAPEDVTRIRAWALAPWEAPPSGPAE